MYFHLRAVSGAAKVSCQSVCGMSKDRADILARLPKHATGVLSTVVLFAEYNMMRLCSTQQS